MYVEIKETYIRDKLKLVKFKNCGHYECGIENGRKPQKTKTITRKNEFRQFYFQSANTIKIIFGK